MNIGASLPSAVSRPCIATSEPSASPSMFSCVASTKEESWRMGSGTCWRTLVFPLCSLMSVPSSCAFDLLQERIDAHGAIRRVVVGERQRRRALQVQLGGDPALQVAVRALQAGHAGLALLLVAEHAHVNPSMAQVGAGPDIGHCYESHPRVLQLC